MEDENLAQRGNAARDQEGVAPAIVTFKTLVTPPLREHLLLVFLLILLIAGIHWGSARFAQHKAEDWARYLKYYQPTRLVYGPNVPETKSETTTASTSKSRARSASVASMPNGTPASSPSPTATSTPPPASVARDGQTAEGSPDKPTDTVVEISFEGRRRIENQLQEITERARHHLKVMTDFYTNYYQIVSVMMFTGLIAAIALFFISKNGWSNTSNYLITIFVVMTSATAYYGAYVPVFRIDQNIADNKALYLQYGALSNEVLSYLATKTNPKSEVQKDGDFIHYVDKELARLNNVAVGFDYAKIPTYTGIFEPKPAQTEGTPASSTNATTTK